jgi:predicted enzyme related to lactoylglutathione lyase
VNTLPRYFAGANGELELVDYPGCFVWYELLTTDVPASKAFYRSVIGWEAQDVSTPSLSYSLFVAETVPVCGVMELPEEGVKAGARPRWMGYVGVDDVHATTERIKRLGGTVYVPPTSTNIGLISVVTDPQMVTFGLVSRLKLGREQAAESSKPGHFGWHELLAQDWKKSFAFYGQIFGWQEANNEISDGDFYHPFSANGLKIGGIFTRHPTDPPPFWLLYLNVEDFDLAAERVIAGGGEVFINPQEMPGGISIARCADAQGAAFAIQGRRRDSVRLGWSTEWSGFSSRGRLLAQRRRQLPPDPES